MHISYPIEILLSSKEVKCYERGFVTGDWGLVTSEQGLGISSQGLGACNV